MGSPRKKGFQGLLAAPLLFKGKQCRNARRNSQFYLGECQQNSASDFNASSCCVRRYLRNSCIYEINSYMFLSILRLESQQIRMQSSMLRGFSNISKSARAKHS